MKLGKTIGALAGAATLGLALTACAASTDAGAEPDVTPTNYANPDAPDALKFILPDLVTGDLIDGTELMNQDVVLWFWASWCPTCEAQSGVINAGFEDFPEDVTFLGIAGMADEPSSVEFIDRNAVDYFPHVHDATGDIWEDFQVARQSTLILVNQDGRTHTFAGAYNTADMIEQINWLAEN